MHNHNSEGRNKNKSSTQYIYTYRIKHRQLHIVLTFYPSTSNGSNGGKPDFLCDKKIESVHHIVTINNVCSPLIISAI